MILDADNDGFITIDEFSESIEKVGVIFFCAVCDLYSLEKLLKLSKPSKDGFFAYMDRQHIGMVDFNSFLRVMRKSVITKD